MEGWVSLHVPNRVERLTVLRYLSSEFGFLPPDPSDSPVALRSSPGRVWSDLCERMPGVVARGNMYVRSGYNY